MSHTAKVTLVLPGTPALSNVWSKGQARSAIGASADMMIFAPSGCGVEVRSKYGSGTWYPLQQGGAAVAVPAGETFSIPVGAFGDLRVTGGAQSVDVVFQEVMDN